MGAHHHQIRAAVVNLVVRGVVEARRLERRVAGRVLVWREPTDRTLDALLERLGVSDGVVIAFAHRLHAGPESARGRVRRGRRLLRRRRLMPVVRLVARRGRLLGEHLVPVAARRAAATHQNGAALREEAAKVPSAFHRFPV